MSSINDDDVSSPSGDRAGDIMEEDANSDLVAIAQRLSSMRVLLVIAHPRAVDAPTAAEGSGETSRMKVGVLPPLGQHTVPITPVLSSTHSRDSSANSHP